MLWISFLCINKPSVAPCCLHICDSCTRIAQEKSGERYPNSVVSFSLNRAHINIRTPNSPCTDNTWFFEYFYRFLGFVVREISGHLWGLYQSHYCASAVAFLFSFVYVLYLNSASFLYGKQIKSKLWTKLYLWMIFICVRLNRLHFHECRPMPLNILSVSSLQWTPFHRIDVSFLWKEMCLDKIYKMKTKTLIKILFSHEFFSFQ